MGIVAWFRKRRLQRRKRNQALRLSEIRTILQRIKRRQPRMHSMIEPELTRIRELKKQLTKVKNEEELRFWLSLFNMCVPVFDALLNTSPAHTKTRKLRKYHGK